ncbi:MAG: MBL fold metallo-hydrolase [Candidatus Aegiribacteria sp.]|nr:MBL fold metallo-hydrolase [Candidatus Aegiribacteria sp.]
MSFRIQILFNNTAGRTDLATGIGFSALVGNDLLFDTGNNGGSLFANMEILGIDPMKISAVVISHDHWDHTGGLDDLLAVKPGITVYGCPGFGEELKRKITLNDGVFTSCSEYRQIGPGIFLTGELPGYYKGTYLAEQAMILETESGISIITGCAHPGIVNIVDRVIEHFSIKKLHAIIGGFHLNSHTEEELERVLDDLGNRDINLFAPMHCTGEKAIQTFSNRFSDKACILKSGDSLEI